MRGGGGGGLRLRLGGGGGLGLGGGGLGGGGLGGGSGDGLGGDGLGLGGGGGLGRGGGGLGLGGEGFGGEGFGGEGFGGEGGMEWLGVGGCGLGGRGLGGCGFGGEGFGGGGCSLVVAAVTMLSPQKSRMRKRKSEGERLQGGPLIVVAIAPARFAGSSEGTDSVLKEGREKGTNGAHNSSRSGRRSHAPQTAAGGRTSAKEVEGGCG
jgi:hypothetical protein